MDGEIVNPLLADLGFLVGDWSMTISRASFLQSPDQVVTGSVEFRPIEAGMLLAMRQLSRPGEPPLASWVIGRDGSSADYRVLYTDERRVSRVYAMSFRDATLRIWRDDPDFSQRYSARVSDDRRSLEGRWEKRTSGGEWEHDFDILYSRP
jgi:hypothetical protein